MKKIDFDAVVFDMDGTIFDTETIIIECWKKVADLHGIPDIENTYIGCLGLTREESYEKFSSKYGKDFPYWEYEKEMLDIFFGKYLREPIPVKKGAVRLLEKLREEKIPVALASSTEREYVLPEMDNADLTKYFDKIICGDMVTNSKPDPEIFLKACEALGVNPERTIGIEDSFSGIRALHAAGMHPLMVPDILMPTDEIRALCDRVCVSLDSVLEYLFEA